MHKYDITIFYVMLFIKIKKNAGDTDFHRGHMDGR